MLNRHGLVFAWKLRALHHVQHVFMLAQRAEWQNDKLELEHLPASLQSLGKIQSATTATETVDDTESALILELVLLHFLGNLVPSTSLRSHQR